MFITSDALKYPNNVERYITYFILFLVILPHDELIHPTRMWFITTVVSWSETYHSSWMLTTALWWTSSLNSSLRCSSQETSSSKWPLRGTECSLYKKVVKHVCYIAKVHLLFKNVHNKWLVKLQTSRVYVTGLVEILNSDGKVATRLGDGSYFGGK